MIYLLHDYQYNYLLFTKNKMILLWKSKNSSFWDPQRSEVLELTIPPCNHPFDFRIDWIQKFYSKGKVKKANHPPLHFEKNLRRGGWLALIPLILWKWTQNFWCMFAKSLWANLFLVEAIFRYEIKLNLTLTYIPFTSQLFSAGKFVVFWKISILVHDFAKFAFVWVSPPTTSSLRQL